MYLNSRLCPTEGLSVVYLIRFTPLRKVILYLRFLLCHSRTSGGGVTTQTGPDTNNCKRQSYVKVLLGKSSHSRPYWKSVFLPRLIWYPNRQIFSLLLLAPFLYSNYTLTDPRLQQHNWSTQIQSERKWNVKRPKLDIKGTLHRCSH